MSDMGIKLKQSFSFEALSNAAKENAKNAIVSVLTDVGMQCVAEARNNGNYEDQTGNLRSSIGFAVVVDGKIVTKSGFTQVQGRGENMALVRYKTKAGKEVKFWAKGKSGDGSEGVRQGEQLLDKLASEHSTGICLIVAAGMSYAIYVEGLGKNVLTSAELLAERVIPDTLQQLGFTVKKK